MLARPLRCAVVMPCAEAFALLEEVGRVGWWRLGTREALSIEAGSFAAGLLRCCDERLLVRAIVEGMRSWPAIGMRFRRSGQAGGREAVGGHVGHDAGPAARQEAQGGLLLPHESFVLRAQRLDRAPRVRGAAFARRRAVQRAGPSSFRCRAPSRKPRASRVPTRSIRGSGRLRAAYGWRRFSVLPRALPRAGGQGVLGRY